MELLNSNQRFSLEDNYAVGAGFGSACVLHGHSRAGNLTNKRDSRPFALGEGITSSSARDTGHEDVIHRLR